MPPNADLKTLPPLSRKKRRWFAITSVALGLLFSTLAIEVVLRVILYRQALFFEKFQEETIEMNKGEELRLVDMVRPSPVREQVFQLRAGLSGIFVSQPVTINSHGFRGEEADPEKQPNTRRIAILGDSVSFGWGVDEESSFPAILEKLLNQSTAAQTTSPATYQVLNFSVPAYNTVMELATLKSRVLAFAPDMLILCLVSNDDELPNFLRMKPQVLSLRKSFIVEAVRDRMVGRKWGDTARSARGGIVDTTGYMDGKEAGYRPELVPEEYRFLIGPGPQASALREMREICRQHQIRPLCLVYENIYKDTKEAVPLVSRNPHAAAAAKAGWPLCSATEPLLVEIKKPGAGLYDHWVSETDLHPSALAHSIIAQTLFGCIRAAHSDF